MPQDEIIDELSEAIYLLKLLEQERELLLMGLHCSQKVSKRNQLRLRLAVDFYCSSAQNRIEMIECNLDRIKTRLTKKANK